MIPIPERNVPFYSMKSQTCHIARSNYMCAEPAIKGQQSTPQTRPHTHTHTNAHTHTHTQELQWHRLVQQQHYGPPDGFLLFISLFATCFISLFLDVFLFLISSSSFAR